MFTLMIHTLLFNTKTKKQYKIGDIMVEHNGEKYNPVFHLCTAGEVTKNISGDEMLKMLATDFVIVE